MAFSSAPPGTLLPYRKKDKGGGICICFFDGEEEKNKEKLLESGDDPHRAALALVANVMFNLDEFVTRR